MADVDIDPFVDHDKTDSHPDDTSERIPLPPVTPGGGSTSEDPLRNQNMNKKHHLEDRKLKKEGSQILTLTVYIVFFL